MGSTSKYGRARINPTSPEALGVCNACGFLYNLRDLRFQFDWAGTSMINRQIRVCPTCYDLPQEQLRTIVLPPDPLPVWQPRPEPYLVDEVNELWLKPVGIGTKMFSAASDLQAQFGVELGIVLGLTVSGELAADMAFGVGLIAAFSDESEIAANMAFGAGLTAAFSDAGTITADVDVTTPATGASIVWTDDFIDLVGSTSPVTATGLDIGTDDADRIVVVIPQLIFSASDAQITGVTIGGIAAKRAALAQTGAFESVFSEIWWANVPTGSTANVVITYTGGGGSALTLIDVYAAYDVNTDYPFWSTNTGFTVGTNVSTSILIPDGSVSLAGSYNGANSTASSITWTNLTEDNDNALDIAGDASIFIHMGAASREDATAAGSVSVQASVGAANTIPICQIVAGVLSSAEGEKWVAVTSTDASYPVPADWNNSDNSVYAIGSSANATDPGATGGGGTGGGAWARTDNVTLTPGGTCNIVIGANGSDSYLSNTGSAPTSTSEGVLAKGGTANSGRTGGSGGASGSCIGTAANSGGAGGAGQNAADGAGGGGGGAGGPAGAGAAGATGGVTGGGGGGGANGGGTGSSFIGGASRTQMPGGTGNGGAGFGGGGGAGKSLAGAGTAAGSMDNIWIDTDTGVIVGPGSGGGGGRGGGASDDTATGGQGGLYGGGAGGSGEDATVHAGGRPGLVVLRYRPAAP